MVRRMVEICAISSELLRKLVAYLPKGWSIEPAMARPEAILVSPDGTRDVVSFSPEPLRYRHNA